MDTGECKSNYEWDRLPHFTVPSISAPVLAVAAGGYRLSSTGSKGAVA
jgi:hypothetical protein